MSGVNTPLRRKVNRTLAIAAVVYAVGIGTIAYHTPQKPRLIFDWGSVYLTEQGMLHIGPWTVDTAPRTSTTSKLEKFPKQIFLQRDLPAETQVWVEGPKGDSKQYFVELGELRSIIYAHVRMKAAFEKCGETLPAIECLRQTLGQGEPQ